MFDVAIVGGGPAGSSCAAFCARAGLRVVVFEREDFPREKVCGDCLNPSVWPVLRRLELESRVRELPHAQLDRVDFIALNGRAVVAELPPRAEIAIKRSLFDQLLLTRARELGAEIHERVTIAAAERSGDIWLLNHGEVSAQFLVAADGRNSTVARLLGLLPRIEKERVALQAHVALPRDFGSRIVLQLLPWGYSGQAPVNDRELNLCLVGRAATLPQLRNWATQQFRLSPDQQWRTITPLARPSIAAAHRNLFLVGDAARVVEPFTGEGIFYALRSGELAADAIVNGADYEREHAEIYRGRLWINQLARAAVVSPRVGSALLGIAKLHPRLLAALTRKVTK